MLTDYHTHLRPDDLGASAKEYFTEANVSRYVETAEERGISGARLLRARLPLSGRPSTSGAIRSGRRTQPTTSTPTAISWSR
jgi:hypothetical protein